MVKKIDTHVDGLNKRVLTRVVQTLRVPVLPGGDKHDFLIYAGNGHVYAFCPFYGVQWYAPELAEKFGESIKVVPLVELEKTRKALSACKSVAWADLAWSTPEIRVHLTTLLSVFPSEVFHSASSTFPAFNPECLVPVIDIVSDCTAGKLSRYSKCSPVSFLPQSDGVTSSREAHVPWLVTCSDTDVVAAIMPMKYLDEDVSRSALESLKVIDALGAESSKPSSEPVAESAKVEPPAVTAEFPTVQADTETGDMVDFPKPTAPSVHVDVVEAVIPVGSNTCPEFDSIESGTVYRFGLLHHRVAYVKVSADRSRVIIGRKAGYVAGSDPVGEARLNRLLDSLGVAL